MGKSKIEIACGQPAGHGDHLCLLMERGQTALVREAAVDAAYYCGNCEARARDPRALCKPRPLKGA